MKKIELPTPPSGLYVSDGSLPTRWTCLVTGWSKNTLSGRLLNFDLEQQQIKVQSAGSKSPTAIKFAQFKSLVIEGGLMPLKNEDQASDAAVDDLNFQPFNIQLVDGSRLEGESAGVHDLVSGLWLFMPNQAGDGLARCFVPRVGVESYEASDVVSNGFEMFSFASSDFKDTVTAEIGNMPLDFAATGTPASQVVEAKDELLAALERQARIKPVPIGEALVGMGKITHAQLGEALRRQKGGKNTPLGQILIDMGLVSAQDLQVAFARKMGYPVVDLKKFQVDARALRSIPMALAMRLRAVPLLMNKAMLVVAMPDPLQFKIIEELEFTTQLKVLPVLTAPEDLNNRITKLYREIGAAELGSALELASSSASTADPGMDALQGQDVFLLASELVGESGETEDERQIEQSDNTLVKLINSMITEAYQQGASDIHIEPYPGRQKLKIRFRIDGQMRPYLELPASYRSALIARIKIMCDLDISEKRKAQDGKINFSKFGGLKIELRVATIPTTHGLEDVVMRILASAKTINVDQLGLSARNLQQMLHASERPYGMILCVGPTGSGKTTTLHAALHHINQPDRKIWTAEDPVEITQYGLRQIQVNPRIGWTFASALRSLLRADPDVIMVGEIRDQETAEIAVEASLTGHLVMSTLHTNTAAETISRLMDLGLDPFSFADSLLAVMAQRLVRRFCTECVASAPMTAEELEQLTLDYQIALPADDPLQDRRELHRHWRETHGKKGELQSYHPVGCERCGQTGYRGRVGIHELLVTSPPMRRLIQTRGSSESVLHQAMRDGMRTLRQDGIEKVLQGLTSLAEIRANSNA